MVLRSGNARRQNTPPSGSAPNEVSILPLELSRARCIRVWPPIVVKSPPARILPSACTTRLNTVPLASAEKEASTLPSDSKRAMHHLDSLSTNVNQPPIKIFPSGCKASAAMTVVEENTGSQILGLKLATTDPSTLRRARFVRGRPPTLVNCPPIKIHPSGCFTMARTVPFTRGSNPSFALWASASGACAQRRHSTASAMTRSTRAKDNLVFIVRIFSNASETIR